MEWIQTLTGIVATAVMFGAMFKFMWSRLDKKFDGINEKFDSIDRKFEATLLELKEIRLCLHSLEVRISRLETQDEERFRNEIKLLVAERKAK